MNFSIGFDTSEGDANVATLQQKIDTQEQEWAIIRRETLQQMSDINRGINLTIQTVRLTAKLTGQTLSPVINALLSLVGTTTSMVLSTATLIATGSLGVLAGVAVALAAAAFTYQALTTAELIANSDELKEVIANVDQSLALAELAARGLGGPL